MTTLNNDELRDVIKTLLGSDTTYLIPPGADETEWYMDNIMGLIATHDQQLLGAILEGIVDNVRVYDEDDGFCTTCSFQRTDDSDECLCIIRNQRNEETRQHIKSVFNKEGE